MARMVSCSAWLAVSLALGFTLGAQAQDCNALIVHGMRNIEIEKSTSAAIATKYYRNCGVDYSSKTDDQLAQLEVEVFGQGKGGGQYSRTQREEALKQWCVVNASSAQGAESLYKESQSIMAEALQAWTACNNLLRDQVFTSPAISADQRTVDLSVRYTGPGIAMFYGVNAEDFSCDVRLPGVEPSKVKATLDKGFQLGSSAAAINCKRKPPTVEKVDGTTYQRLSRGTISVRTASFPYQLFFPEQYNPTLPVQASERIEKRLDVLNRILVPVGAVVPFALTVEEIGTLAPYWLPADGRIVNDQESALNGRALPDMVNRFALGLDPGKDAVDNVANAGGTLDVNDKFRITGQTDNQLIDPNIRGFEDFAVSYYNGQALVWDTPNPERAAIHRHNIAGEFDVTTRLPRQPYRALVYMVRVR